MSSLNVYYKVYGSNTHWACCTCIKDEMDDICKHQMILLLKNNSTVDVKQQCMELYNVSLSKLGNTAQAWLVGCEDDGTKFSNTIQSTWLYLGTLK